MFRQFTAFMSSFLLVATSALATSGQVTANLNLRSGPSTQDAIILTIPNGSAVEILDCNESGSWCAISFGGHSGFASGRYVVLTVPESATSFPRAYAGKNDTFIVLYEPQYSAWTDFKDLHALIATEVRRSEEAEPIFGVIGVSASTTAVTEDRKVIASNIRVTQLDFSSLYRAELEGLAVGVGGLLPTEPITLAEERILAGLASYQNVRDVEGIKADPPVILVSYVPSRLVQTDGPAIFAPVPGSQGIEFVVNTNWDILRVDGSFWIRDQTSWVTASTLEGPWTVVQELPDAIKDLPDDGNWDAARASLLPVTYDEGMPEFFYSDRPAEIIAFDGPAEFEAVPGTELRWASNTESDLFHHRLTDQLYYLVSGRWFSSPSLKGPWSFSTLDLPPDFLRIPENKPYYTVRASVPGTSEANEARLRASIPEVAQVTLDGMESPEIVYDGDPHFVPIDGTDLAYAANTSAQVIHVADQYFAVIDGIWFVSDSAMGPWEPALQIPQDVYTIPPSSPMHNVTYEKVCDTNPTSVTYCYTSGYKNTFLAWGVLAFGLGWWFGDRGNKYYYHYYPYYPPGRYPPGYYRPPPVTYGGGAYYNPARGSFGRYGYVYGPYRGVEARSAYDPATGTFVRGARAYGAERTRGFVHASNPRTGTTAVVRGKESIYGMWATGAVKRGSDYVRVTAGEGARGGQGVKWDSSRGSGFALNDRRGNTFAGRDGNVYRKSGDNWQQWDPNGGWQVVPRPSRDQLGQQGQSWETPERGRQRLGDKDRSWTGQRVNSGAPLPSQVHRDAAARASANQRSHAVRKQRSPKGARAPKSSSPRATSQRAQTPTIPQSSNKARSSAPRSPSRAKAGAVRTGRARSGGTRGGNARAGGRR